jgi:hypothetical protein
MSITTKIQTALQTALEVSITQNMIDVIIDDKSGAIVSLIDGTSYYVSFDSTVSRLFTRKGPMTCEW